MSSVNFEIRDNIGFITLNRPEKLNSFTREMALLLQNRLDECASLHEVRAVYLTGAGRAFSAGQDLSEIVGSGEAGIVGSPNGGIVGSENRGIVGSENRELGNGTDRARQGEPAALEEQSGRGWRMC